MIDDPSDVALLRFYVQRIDDFDGEWIDVEDASYCTNTPVDTPDEVQRGLLVRLMDAFYEPVRSGRSVKKLGEELSWIGPDWLAAK